eukprot:6896548-Prymnesium_polylepis.1
MRAGATATIPARMSRCARSDVVELQTGTSEKRAHGQEVARRWSGDGREMVKKWRATYDNE